ncbi:MAG: prephenate dehydrogenase [Verrucomicrobiales bacterium]
MFPDSIAILGPGLLGGSLALDLAAAGVADLRLWARREAVRAEAEPLGLAPHFTTDLEAAVAGAELVVLATPVGAMPALANRIAAVGEPPKLVTDMGSVKAVVERATAPVLRAAGIPFVGSHPMCGSEQKGLAAARRGLFAGAMCMLTPDAAEKPETVEKVSSFWSALGCRVARLNPVDHDATVARISHLPHLAAALLSQTAAGGKPDLLAFAAGGFRDTTRVAAGPPDMWTEILLENRAALAPLVRQLGEACASAATALESADQSAIRQWLEQGKEARAPLDRTSILKE